ncbi:MAG: BrnA antitoxin family protein, partial [Burkholderiales bacterium]|nr:BrnA antitoxin family protein [Burkholderiales bacterium]
IDMSKKSTTSIPDDAAIRAQDIASGKLVMRKRGANGAVLPAKQRVNIYLDSAIVEHFKAEAGERGYQTLIKEALKNAIQAETIEKTIRQVIWQELKEYKV